MLLIDDHEMVRMGLAAFLEAQPDIEVAGEASDGGSRASIWPQSFCRM
ncbi:Hypothetical protein ACI5QL_03386 [Bacillus velezensis]